MRSRSRVATVRTRCAYDRARSPPPPLCSDDKSLAVLVCQAFAATRGRCALSNVALAIPPLCIRGTFGSAGTRICTRPNMATLRWKTVMIKWLPTLLDNPSYSPEDLLPEMPRFPWMEVTATLSAMAPCQCLS